MLRNDNVPENGTAPYIRVRHQGRVRESLEMAAEMRQEQQRHLCAAGIALLLPSLGHLASLQPEDGQLLFSSLLSSTFLTHSACLGDALPAAASPRWKKKKKLQDGDLPAVGKRRARLLGDDISPVCPEVIFM